MRYRFGQFEFDPGSNELFRSGVKVSLEAQPARALGLLLAHSGEIVTRDQLRAELWPPGTHVDFDRGIAYCLSEIRSSLGDSGLNPRFIETLPRRGYRFIAPVSARVSAPPLPRRRLIAAAVAATAAGIGSAVGIWQWKKSQAPIRVAISVFDNETGHPEFDLWVTTLSDLVLTHLSTLAPNRLEWIANSAPLRRPRNIRNLAALRKELDAGYLLLGQLQSQPPGLRFITHLIRMSDEAHLKANRISWPNPNPAGLDAAVLAEFERAVKKHILGLPEVPV